ncbi:MAG: hypothetical protein ACLQVI_25760 [Polyangiaceae bacterium]
MNSPTHDDDDDRRQAWSYRNLIVVSEGLRRTGGGFKLGAAVVAVAGVATVIAGFVTGSFEAQLWKLLGILALASGGGLYVAGVITAATGEGLAAIAEIARATRATAKLLQERRVG